MDGRDGMAMPGPNPYYTHRVIGPNPGSGSQHGFHGPLGISNPNPNPNLPVQSSTVGTPFQVDSPPSISPVKRKRGRPRKYGPDRTVSLAPSPLASTPGSGSVTVVGSGSGMGSGSVGANQKRGRGRPPGTGRKQQLASLGEWVFGSAGMGFTPHIITISVGEDIAAKIMSFSQQGPRAVCILSANGAVSTVTLRQPATSGGTVTYEGRFEILCLSGSYLLTDDGGSCSRSGGLSISLSSPDGRVIGGGVGGLLIAASPVQVIVGSFIYGGSKGRNKTKTSQESGGDSELPTTGDKQIISPCSTLPNQGYTPSSLMGVWPGPRQMDMRNAHIDIDLTRG